MSLPTFAAVAELVGVQLCTDRDCQLWALERHHVGYVQDGVVHWRERLSTKRGLWNFLKLAAAARRTESYGLIETVWLNHTTAYELGLQELGIRFPREYSDEARAHVRALMADYNDLWIPDETRRKIIRWAQE